MNFKISKQVFYNALQVAARAISSYSPLPAFSGIKIEAKADSLILIGSDSDISIRTVVLSSDESSLVVKEMGSIVIESRYIMEIIRKIDSDELEFEVLENASAKISDASSEFKINGMRASEYPNIDFSKPTTLIEFKSECLKSMISQTIFATSKSENRPALTGVNFACSGNELICTATDSYRLARKKVILENQYDFNITIPSRNLSEVVKTLDMDEDMVFAVSEKKAQFIIGNTIIQSRLIDGAFPETNRLIPLSFSYELEINYSDIAGAIDRASFIKNDGISVIKLSLNEDECVLSTRAQEVGSSKETLKDTKFSGEHLDISFNGQYVFEALRALNRGKIRFSFCGEMKPFIIQSVDDENVIQLVLPLRTYA